MILVAPYSTDAPIYHLPLVTGGLVLANIGIFFATTFQLMLGNVELESIEWLLLEFDTVNPLQWITGAFMHADFMHLLGNMFFLWAFGLVVEGKIGSLPFLAMYMGIAAIDGAAVQLPMFLLGSDGSALGASGVIFALMVIAMLWAPENEMDCFYLIFFRMGTFEVRIIKLGATFVMLQLVFLWLGGFSMSSEMLHMVGASIGLPIGVLLLRKDWVDCEGWDVISRNDWLQEYDILCSPEQRQRLQRKQDDHYDPVTSALKLAGSSTANVNPAALAGTLTPRPVKKASGSQPNQSATAVAEPAKKRLFGGKPAAVEAPQPDVTTHPEFNRLAYLLRQAIDSQSLSMAEQHFGRLEQLGLSRGLNDKTLMNYVKLLAANKKWPEAIRPLTLVDHHHGEEANQARIRLAQIHLRVFQNKEAAKQALTRIAIAPESSTPETQKLLLLRDQLLAQANA